MSEIILNDPKTQIKKNISIFQLQGCKAKALEFLSEFIEKVGKKILPYAVDIKVNIIFKVTILNILKMVCISY